MSPFLPILILADIIGIHTPRVLARIIFKPPKKHVATTMTAVSGEIFSVKCQKQAFSFNKREAKVYCYAFLHALKRDIINMHKHEKTIKTNFFFFLVSC
jgi:hypothetical protein